MLHWLLAASDICALPVFYDFAHKVNFNYRCMHGCASEHRYLDCRKASSDASLTQIHQTPRIEENMLAAILFKHFLGANFSFSVFA